MSALNGRIMALYASCLLLLLLFLEVADGAVTGTVAPSNSTLEVQQPELDLFYTMSSMQRNMGQITLQPLTQNMGIGQPESQLNTVHISGTVVIADPFNYLQVLGTNIVLISCDPNSNTSNLDPASIVAQVATIQPEAIILYSVSEPHCEITGDFRYTSLLTTVSQQEAQLITTYVESNANRNTMNTVSGTVETQATAASSSPSSTSQPQSGPTTAVAMSILYSITGIITVLFLVIIATGAIRAHRHPERYGPRRGGFPGRPRQSRAKGLARAMLETLPIVKFGDEEAAKPGSQDVELEEGTPHDGADATANKKSESKEATKEATAPHVDADTTESGLGPDTQATAPSVKSKDETAESLGCSICTEDFTKGEDVRVLPCNHKYHPACIDPWLLNVSGTCPLCRVDLRPTPTNESTASNPDGELAPPLGEDSAENRNNSNGRINVAHLRAVPASERLAALRALRAERRQQQRDILAQRGIPDPDADEDIVAVGGDREQRSSRRLTMRLKEKFRVRTHRGGSAVTTNETAAEAGPSSAPIAETQEVNVAAPPPAVMRT